MIRKLVVLCCLCAIALQGCAPTKLSGKFKGDKFSSDTRVTVGIVMNKSGTEYPDIKPEQLLKEALTEALEQEGILYKNGQQGPRITIDANIIEYQMGNAFLRWVGLLPLKDAADTSAMVQCDVRNEKGTLVATIDTFRTVEQGVLFGLGSVGAWSYIFKDVAKDVVTELKTKGFNQ